MRLRMVGRNGAHPLKGDADSDCFVIRSWHKAQNVLGGEEKQSNQAVSPGCFQETNLRVWKFGIPQNDNFSGGIDDNSFHLGVITLICQTNPYILRYFKMRLNHVNSCQIPMFPMCFLVIQKKKSYPTAPK